MKNAQRKLLKKFFTSFLGIYFLITGVLIGGGDALASNFGDICTSNSALCTSPHGCQTILGTSTKFCLPSLPVGGPECLLGTTCSGGLECKPIPGISGNGWCNPIAGLGAKGAACSAANPCASNLECKCVKATMTATTCSNICSEKSISITSINADMSNEILPPPDKYNNSAVFTPQVSLPGFLQKGVGINVGEIEDNPDGTGKNMSSELLPLYVGAFYRYGLMIVGIIATVILMAGGIKWLTSAGNDGAVTKAKEMIFGSLAGVALLYGSYLILNTINPELVQMKSIKTKILLPVTTLCCQHEYSAEITSSEKCKASGGARKYGYVIEGPLCVKAGCCEVKLSKPYCIQTSEKSCNDLQNNVKTFIATADGTCASEIYCKDKMADCGGKEDGEHCSAATGANAGICYGGNCLAYGTSEIGEPCGNRQGSKCYKDQRGTSIDERCGKTTDGQELYRDMVGGLTCKLDLFCCNTSK